MESARRGSGSLPSLTVLLLALLIAGTAFAQQDRGWRAHTSMRQVRALVAGGSAVWGGTSGGLFRYDRESRELTRYTTVEGLSQIDVRALAYDSERAHVWIGYADGRLDRLDPATETVVSVGAVERATRYPDRAIHALSVRENRLLVGTAFGLVVVDLEGPQVRDSYVRFGDQTEARSVRDVAIGSVEGEGTGSDRYWLATEDGVVHAAIDHPNLRDPDAWTLESVAGAEGPLLSTVLHENALYVGATNGGFVREGGTYTRVWQTERPVRDLLSGPTGLVGVFQFALRRSDREDRLTLAGRSDLRAIATTPGGTYWVADGERGLASFTELPATGPVDTTDEVVPAGPYHGLFGDLDVDGEGRLWAGGSPGPGTGFYRLSPDGWTSFTRQFVPDLGDRDGFDVVEPAPDGGVWAGSQGDGLVRLGRDGSIQIFDASNSALEPAPGTPDFVRVSGIAAASDGSTWVTNLFADPSLVVRDREGNWHGLPHLQSGPDVSGARFEHVFVDRGGRKWIGLREEQDAEVGRGLMVFDDGGTPAEQSDDRYRVVEEGGFNAGLPDNTVTSFAQDGAGRVWIGTESGLAYFPAPSAVIPGGTGTGAQWPVREGSLFLNELAVSDIAVDPAGRKWLATTDGAWLIDAAATEVRMHLTRENSPLFSDNVVAVTVDPTTGHVYFATDAGLLSMRGSALRPAERAGSLEVYPNPVERASLGADGLITVDGLVADARVRIVTPSGRLVHRVRASSGRVQWDGTDRSGRPVPPGVYLVVAAGGDEGGAFGKIAVVE